MRTAMRTAFGRALGRMPSVAALPIGPALLVAALLPATAVVAKALAPTSVHAAEHEPSAVERLLAKVPSDPSVLINVPYQDLPASPDFVNLGKRSTKALERCLADNVDADARARCAIVLEALADRRALATLQAALDDWEPLVRYRVVKALGAVPDKSSVARLIALYLRKDEEPRVRAAVVGVLGKISDQRVVTLLRAELVKTPDGGDLRPALFDALWQLRHLLARDTLIDDTRKALGSDSDSLVLSATLAAAELGSPRHVAALEKLIDHPSVEIRNKAVYALGRVGDKTATKALLATLPKVRDSRMLNNIAFALERLDKQSFYVEIAKTVEHKQAVIRLNAAFVLGDVRHAEGLRLLEKALGDPSDFVRTSAVAAMGKLALSGDELARALAALAPLANSASVPLREEAIYALHRLTPGGSPDRIYSGLYAGLDPRKYHAAIRRAALALGDAGDARVRGYLLNCLLGYSCSVAEVGPYFTKHTDEVASGRMLLGWARGREGLAKVVATLRPSGTLPVAMSALRDAWASPESQETLTSLQILANLGDSSAQELIVARAATDRTLPRVWSLVAAGRLGYADAPAKLVQELEVIAAEGLGDFVRAAATIEEPTVRASLDAALEQKSEDADLQIAIAAAAIRLAWNPDRAIFRFLAGLASPDGFERALAERYLAKNNDRRVTWLLRRALAREGSIDVKDRLRAALDERS